MDKEDQAQAPQANAVAGQAERSVRPLFCGDCKHCGSKADNGPAMRSCAAAGARQEAHIQQNGATLNALWSAPLSWVYVNSQHAERCRWFVAA